ncbi:cell wall hydrolase [Sphingopyxis sp.]|uniref:cell wall hydrolase n=1 Tax=Sphingopyxis sp. TaxID=1908224 RepID=UPI0025FC50A6|nr:cell wall hydrolase [Sphingopyxis sp.]
MIIAALLAATGLACSAWWLFASDAGQRREAVDDIARRPAAAPPRPPTPPPLAYKPLSADVALAENAALPFSTAPVEQAPPLVVPLTASAFAGRRSAMDCLTAAVYYEAAQESDSGKRGVAQVVLNRARHPAFPNSICGVVYQGADRKTGCQFTFTCDGSLARKPSRAGWDAARRIAIAALSGRVEPSVGMATHYHADYVVPYWAASLAKIAQVDHHIFYRWTGGWGRRSAFTQAVSQEQFSGEPQISDIPGLDPESLDTPPLDGKTLPSSRIVADQLAGALDRSEPSDPPSNILRPSIKADETAAKPAADMASGSLRFD